MNTNDPIEKFRSNFHRTEKHVHLNNAGVAPISRAAREAVERWVKVQYEEGMFGATDSFVAVEKTRATLGRVLGCQPSNVAFFQTAASAISQVAFGLKFNPGDEIVVWDQEYPSNYHPWRIACERSGAKLVVAASAPDSSTPLEALEAVLTPKTRLIAFSSVQYRTGAIIECRAVANLARKRGIMTCADIIQGAGIIPFDFEASGLDFACGGSHKWFVSPLGVGYLLGRTESLEKLSPIMVGAMTFGGPNSLPSDTVMEKEAKRFEPGGKNVLELVGFGASLELIEEVSVARIGQEVEWLSRKLMHGLRERGYSITSPHGSHFRGSIVNFTPGPDSKCKTVGEVSESLNKAGVSFGIRPPGVRLAPHAFNTEQEIQRVLAML